MRPTPRIFTSLLNDPLTWEVEPSQFFTFASNEDAKRAEVIFNARERELAEAVELLSAFVNCIDTNDGIEKYLMKDARDFLQRMEKK